MGNERSVNDHESAVVIEVNSQPSIPHSIDDGFPRRLSKVVKNSGKSLRQFAIEAGISDSILRKYLAGTSDPGRKNLISISEVGRVSIEYLATGAEHLAIGTVSPKEYVPIPMLNLEQFTNFGKNVGHEFPEESPFSFHREWIDRLSLHRERTLEIIITPNDNMAPTLCKGDWMLVDRSATTLRNGVLYVFAFAQEKVVDVRRALLSEDGGCCLLKVDHNPNMDQLFKLDDKGIPKILGEVVWVGRVMTGVYR